MQLLSVREVEKVLRLSRSTIRGLISRGFVSPARGPRREYRFTFQDLIVLRTARALALANVPRGRITRSLRELRRNLPEVVPLSGLSICAVGEQVVVRDRGARWHADSGQYLLELDVQQIADGSLQIVEHVRPVEPPQVAEPDTAGDADQWFQKALDIESENVAAACVAYEKCLASDPEHFGARINWGRLLHEKGRLAEAEKVYRGALESSEEDPTVLFNLGVLLEDRGKAEAAIEIYQRTLAADPDFADAHFNLARLFEIAGKPQHAIRHLASYRRLLESGSRS
jgi:tetratricopeptide (TPR) repeat protein